MLYIYKFFRYQHIKYIMKYKEQNNKILKKILQSTTIKARLLKT